LKLTDDSLRRLLLNRCRRQLPQKALRPAAVLLPFFEHEGEDWVLLTRRTDELPHHAGEISFPGGACDADDAGPVAAALREAEEEVGIEPASVEVLGCLDDFVSVHGYHVLPVVGRLHAPGGWRANPAEIAELIELPLSSFFAPGVHHRENWRHRGRPFPVHFYRIGRHEVWGLTAAILHSLFQLAGLET